MLQQELAARGIKTRIVWLRMNYMLARPVLLYCRLVGLTHRPIVNGNRISIHEFHKAPFVATLVQYLHWLDTALAYFWKAYLPMRLRGETIICDRFVYDVLIDLLIESGNVSLYGAPIARLLLALIPRESRTFLIQVDRDKILQRRPDVPLMDPYFDLRFEQYASLGQRYGLVAVPNGEEPEDALRIILHESGVGAIE
jgi:hypothetical protein